MSHRERPLTERATMAPGGTRVPLRGPSGRLYGFLDLTTLTIEVKRKGEPAEQIDLRPLLGDLLTEPDEPPGISLV